MKRKKGEYRRNDRQRIEQTEIQTERQKQTRQITILSHPTEWVIKCGHYYGITGSDRKTGKWTNREAVALLID